MSEEVKIDRLNSEITIIKLIFFGEKSPSNRGLIIFGENVKNSILMECVFSSSVCLIIINLWCRNM